MGFWSKTTVIFPTQESGHDKGNVNFGSHDFRGTKLLDLEYFKA